METQIWGFRSVSFWSVLLIAFGIIFLGVRFILHPDVGSAGYGIPIVNPQDEAYGKIKGIRDIFSGVCLLPLLWLRMRKAVAIVFTAATIIPVFDFLMIRLVNGSGDSAHLLIHGPTAVVMLITSFLLFYGLKNERHV